MNPDNLNNSHTCAIPGCAHRIPLHLLMCPGHWRLVPTSIQVRLNRAWRIFVRRRGAHDRSCYMSWRQAAIDSLPKKPITVGDEVTSL